MCCPFSPRPLLLTLSPVLLQTASYICHQFACSAILILHQCEWRRSFARFVPVNDGCVILLRLLSHQRIRRAPVASLAARILPPAQSEGQRAYLAMISRSASRHPKRSQKTIEQSEGLKMPSPGLHLRAKANAGAGEKTSINI